MLNQDQIHHPLPDTVLNTPINQLPYRVSHLNSSIHKLQHDQIKYLEEHIDVCLENHQKKRQLRLEIELAHQAYHKLENMGKIIQAAVSTQIVPIGRSESPVSYDDKIQSAIRHLNYEEIIKYLKLIQDVNSTIKYSQMAASVIGAPTKQNKDKLKSLLTVFGTLNIPSEEKNKLLEICVKVLIQKCFKMYFEQKIFTTNRSQPTFYSDIIQLYQKSFNCTLRLLQCFKTEQYHQGHVANVIFDKFTQNVLIPLVNTNQKEKSLHVIVNFNEIQQNNLLHLLTQSYCNAQLQKQMAFEMQSKSVLAMLKDSFTYDSIVIKLLQKQPYKQEELQQYLQSNRVIQYNKSVMAQLFKGKLSENTKIDSILQQYC